MKSTELTREQLEEEHVAAGVAKWGQEEVPGLLAQAKAMSLETLRVNYDLRHAETDEAKTAACDESMGIPTN